MKVEYTLAGNYYQPSDIELAMQCAEAEAQQLGKSVRLLLESKSQFPVLNGVNGLTVKSNTFSFNSIQGNIETRLQYQYANGDVIVTVCPTIQLLQKMQDSGVSVLIVVPEMDVNVCQDIYHWLDLCSATDIKTGVTMSGIGLPAPSIKRAIGYLIDFCQRMTVDLTHFSIQTGVMADIVNTIKKQNITANYDDVVKYSLLRGLSVAEADILAKAFCQKSLLKTRGCPDYDLYWKTIDDPKWE